MKIKVMNLFANTGSAFVGIDNVPFTEVSAIDINPNKCFEGKVIKKDVFEVNKNYLNEFDFIYASPPKDIALKTKKYLEKLKKPYVLELKNEQEGINTDLILDGYLFGLPVNRKRYYEINDFFVFQPENVKEKVEQNKHSLSDLLGIDWLSDRELLKATPTQYSNYLTDNFLIQYSRKYNKNIEYKEYENMIHKIAGQMSKKWKKDKNDLLTYGWMGFQDAKEKFDPLKGYKFSTYAYIRISGAIIDGLRKEKNYDFKNSNQKLEYIENLKDSENNENYSVLDEMQCNKYFNKENKFEKNVISTAEEVLDEREKEIFNKKFLEEWKNKEIENYFKLSSSQLLKEVKRIKEKIKKYF